jgi:hypothetical protein
MSNLATEKAAAHQMQQEQHRAELVAALRNQRANLIKNGAMESALPVVHGEMSAKDIADATIRMDGIAQAQQRRISSQATSATPNTNSAGKVSAAVQNAGNAMAGAVTGIPVPGTSPGQTPLRSPAVNTPGSERTPLEKAVDAIPFPNGMNPHVTQTGAGLVSTVQTHSGPREVGVSPTFDQVMHARTGGQWQTWTPQQRAQWLRENPAPSTGEVTDTGAGAFDYRGERVLGQKTLQTGEGTARTPGGDRRTTEAIEYDPRYDTMGGAKIAEKYGTPGGENGVRFVHPADVQTASPSAGTGASSSPQHGSFFDSLSDMPAAPAAAANATAPQSPFAGINPAELMGSSNAAQEPPITGADQLKAAEQAKAKQMSDVAAQDAAFQAKQKDASDAQRAQQINAQPAPQSLPQQKEEMDKGNPEYGSPGTILFGENTAAPTPLGTTSMQENPLDRFATSPQDAEFKKRLTDTSVNDGV